MSKGILQLALSGKVPLQLEYREPSSSENVGNRKPPAGSEPLHAIQAESNVCRTTLQRTRLTTAHNVPWTPGVRRARRQIADAFAWLLHV
jgi:hypothetical protein